MAGGDEVDPQRTAAGGDIEQAVDIRVRARAIARIGSVLILNVPNRAAAEAFSANEPLRNAGVFKSVKITRMRRGQWNPDAAPKSAEGS